MLIKQTLKFLPLGLDRGLLGSQAYRVKIPANRQDLLVGQVLSKKYYVLSLLGQGGMNLVYKAKDLQTNKIVAVKALRTDGLSDQSVVTRFQREVQVLNRLNHPRIVGVHDYGTSKRGQPFFVMDYLEGKSLNQVLRKDGRLSVERFQDVFVQVAAAIQHAHKHGAIHRDLKPGNIMLVKLGNTEDYVKIVDFGIAKLVEEASKLTRMGEVWGSPIYMSPEQATGINTDERTDIYSLGIVMYEALTGEVPFLGKNYVETLSKQISEPPLPFDELCPEFQIPRVFERIIFKALEKAPEARYQTMTELKHDLERALSANRKAPVNQQAARKNQQRTTISEVIDFAPPENSSMNIAQTIRSTFNKIKAIAQPQPEVKESAKESNFHTPIQAMRRPSHSRTVVREKSNSLPIKEIKITLMLLAIFVSFWAISSNQYVANFVIQSLVEMDVIPKSAQKDIQMQPPENQYDQSQMQNQDSSQSQSSEKPGLLD
ncbi:serine/threonine protein kinase [bacterium]|nr:serine/threonine protein kinase [bacterium]QQR56926.1 MAG: serine/threonine protein kinase [Candidatus Melainabacteria bacterium]